MTTEIIHQAFCEMIHRHRIHRCLGLTAGHVKVLRHNIRAGRAISVDKKLKLLEKSGWQPGLKQWDDQDLLDLIKLCTRQTDAARDFGPAYILEKFKNSTRN